MRRRAVNPALSATRACHLLAHEASDNPDTGTGQRPTNEDDVAGRSGRSRDVAKRIFTVWLIASVVVLAGCERKDSVQSGFRGTAMAQLFSPARLAAQAEINRIPPPEPSDPYDPAMPMATEVNQNVQVLTDLNALEFARLMQALSTWISPVEGCAYCHNTENLASDEKYTKIVSRRMLEMTRDINTNWKSHVAETGVTCWTCHRGQPVPSDIWFKTPEPKTPSAGVTGNKAGQNTAGVEINGNTSLPFDPLTPFLGDDFNIAVQGTTVLPTGNRSSIKQTEWTYSLMMYMSNSLGVNCTYCHHTRAMGRWEESTPQRVTAWHGIRMVRAMNADYLDPLLPLYPPHRLGPTGDAPKAACATCHKGAFKPMYGVSMLDDYPSLAGVLPGRLKPEAETAPSDEPAAELAPEEAETAAAAGEDAAGSGADGALAAAALGAEAAEASETTVADADEPQAPADGGTDSQVEDTSARSLVADSAAGDGAATSAEVEAPASADGDTDVARADRNGGEAAPDGAAQPGAEETSQSAEVADVQATGDEDLSAEVEAAADAQPASDAEAMIAGTRPLEDAADGEGLSGEPAEPRLALAEVEDRIGNLQEKLRQAAAERQALKDSSAGGDGVGLDATRPLYDPPMMESERLAAELAQIRARIDTQTDRLYGTSNTALALLAADERVAATEARLRHERATLEQRFELAMLERDAIKKEAEYQVAQLSEAHAAAMDAAEERLAATEEKLRQERDVLAKRLDQVLAQKGASETELDARMAEQHAAATEAGVAREQARAQAALEQPATAGDDGPDAQPVADKAHMDALEDAERRLSAAQARLDQERTALQQQLEVVRAQRDEARGEAVSELSKQHTAALEDAEKRLDAIQARLDQQSTALQQQLAVVRAQRDRIEADVQARLEKEHAARMEEARRKLAALEARLDQQTTALEQQLDVVRAQRDEVAEEIAASLRKAHADEVASLQAHLQAAGAKLEQQTRALQQQLEVVRAQRDAAKAETQSRLDELAAEHARALEEMQRDIAAREARLAQERTALEQQLNVVRSQRDSAEAEAEQAEELEALRAELAEADAAVADLRAQLESVESEAGRVRSLYDSAAEVGGRLTEDGILVSLGGDELQFASGSAVLPANELPSLDRTAELLSGRPELRARIEGHTDSSGSAEINQRLSRQRAEAVMQALIERGIDAGRLTAEGVGPDRPVADNATETGRRENRRVEIYLVGAAAP